MSIKEIAQKLNDLAVKNNHAFSKIQEIRRRNGIRPRARSPFASFSIKGDYAFHAGGRKEFQFNIGEDELNGELVFRYGLAFSLMEDKTLHNSKAEFKAKIEGFNKFFFSKTEYFDGFKMWYYSNNHFVEYFNEVRFINDEIFQADNFIFIGKYLKKQADEISINDIETILNTFDYLLPLYESVQFEKKLKEKRIARLCWNDNGWIMPSGKYGKSKHIGSHEAKYGYGHEEWLFDTGKLIGGYHYGFLEPVRQQQDAFTGNTYDVGLFTIDERTKKRYWIGGITNAEVLNENDANKIKREYIKRKWLTEMEMQIKASGANPKGFSDWKGVDLFNIRFLPADLKLNDRYQEIPKDNPIIEQSRYTFAYLRDEFKFSISEGPDNFTFGHRDSVVEKSENGRPEIKTYIREPKAVEIVYLHKEISRRLTEELEKKYGKGNVSPENLAGYGANRIDIVVKDIDDFIFFEIKTYPTLKSSIREAIGQLMEYSLWPDQLKAKRLIVITQPHPDFEKAKTYFKHIRDTYNLPLYYQSYDIEKNILSELV